MLFAFISFANEWVKYAPSPIVVILDITKYLSLGLHHPIIIPIPAQHNDKTDYKNIG